MYNCPQRWSNGGACYVNIGQAPNAVYKGYKRGLYPIFDAALHAGQFEGRKIRLGAYGDPAAVPFDVLNTLVSYGIGHTGYNSPSKAQEISIDVTFRLSWRRQIRQKRTGITGTGCKDIPCSIRR